MTLPHIMYVRIVGLIDTQKAATNYNERKISLYTAKKTKILFITMEQSISFSP